MPGGLAYVEFDCAKPAALEDVLARLGFVAVGRHATRASVLHRQGDMDVVVNTVPGAAAPRLAGFGLRVADAAAAFEPARAAGARAADVTGPATLAVEWVEGSRVGFVQARPGTPAWNADFLPDAGASPGPPSLAGLHWFGLVQAVHADRYEHWIERYGRQLGFRPLPEGRFFGVLPKGRLLASACGRFLVQLVAPPPGAEDVHWDEGLLRVGLGAPDVPAAVRALQARGLSFVEDGPVQWGARGALTRLAPGGIAVELVVSHLRDAAGGGS